jgi:hypothetical protein
MIDPLRRRNLLEVAPQRFKKPRSKPRLSVRTEKDKGDTSMKNVALILLTLAFLASIAVAEDKAMSGWITDAKCAAKGGDLSNSDCAKQCAQKGEKLVFVTDEDKKVLSVENQEALKGHEGHHVSVTGKLDNGTLHVDKVSMLEEPKAPPAK